MDQVLILDRELRNYRRFFHILKVPFVEPGAKEWAN